MILRFLDFEYNSTAEPMLNLVSVAQERYDTETKQARQQRAWLHNRKTMPRIPTDGILVAFNVIAEASAIYSMGLNPLDYKWIDLQAEWKMLTNHCDTFRYGQQLIKGVEKITHNPRGKYENDPHRSYQKPDASFAAACYKLLDYHVDTEHKDYVRDLIIRNDPEEIKDNKQIILEYNTSDVEPMRPMLNKIIRELKLRDAFNFKQMLERGESVAHTAVIAMRGYSVNRAQLRNFSNSIPDILKDVQEHFNAQFPDRSVFNWDKKNNRYAMKLAPIKDWIKNESGKENFWPLTETGEYSLSFEHAWSRLYDFRSPYPEGNFPAQMYRYLRLRQSINGFIPKGANAKDKSNFFTFVGTDARVRPYLNPYGSQSSRFQPKATGYLPLKPSWMRCFIQPTEGKAICGIDYKSQEFYIAALLSNDQAMIDSYQSGDVYFDFAKKAGAVPEDARKQDHKETRAKFKSTVLGIQYLMGPNSLAVKLSQDTGVKHTSEDARELIALFESVYETFARWRDTTLIEYRLEGKLQLSDGWTMFGDNPNHRSVANCPVQGAGAVVLRRAIKLAHRNGLKPVLPLHDALYFEMDDDLSMVDKSVAVMRKAFIDSFDNPEARAIELDVYAFSPSFKPATFTTARGREIEVKPLYVDERGEDEYKRFSKYFVRRRTK